MKMNRKPSCGMYCCGVMLLLMLIYIAGHFVANEIAESAVFLTTNNILLESTYELHSKECNAFLQSDPRAAHYLENITKTPLLPGCFGGGNNQKIILKENDDYDFLILTDYIRPHGFGIENLNPRWKFRTEAYFSFYRIHKDMSHEVRTEFLGSFGTNLYDAWDGTWSQDTHKISISPDGKYIIMSARAVDSRSLGEFRNKPVLLVWKIGDNVVEKDIVNRYGKKIPIIIKTEEELEREKQEEEKKKEELEKKLDEEYLKLAQNVSPNSKPDHPEKVEATLIDDTSVKLTWWRARGANAYHIYQMKTEGTANYWVKIGSAGITPREFVVTGLSPNTTYYFAVESVNSTTGAISEYRKSAHLTTP